MLHSKPNAKLNSQIPSKIILFMSGSIAAFKACQVLSRLVKEGHEVQVVATRSTFEFVGAATLEGLSGRKVLSDLWERGHAMDHIHLTRWADFGILCPASANTIARIHAGLADDLVTAMILAWPAGKPLTIVPAMNSQMLNAFVTQQNIAALAARGFTVTSTQSGSLACGEEGEGRMLEPEQIWSQIFVPDARLGRVLVTGGATREPIDGIRFLSNVSTGQTAATVVDELEALGWDVTYLFGAGAAQPRSSDTKKISFSDFNDLDQKLQAELALHDYRSVVHCAAVSDYSVRNARPDIKLKSDQELHLELERNFKILPRLKEYSRAKDICVIGFKLSLGGTAEELVGAARGSLSESVDAIVANDWKSVESDRTLHPTVLVQAESLMNLRDLKSLSQELHYLIQGDLHDPLS